MRLSKRTTIAALSMLLVGAWMTSPTTASAKTKKMKSCATAEMVLATTGVGDTDGDGLSNCRETKQLGTSPTLSDTDGDGLSDSQELMDHSDPLVADSDHDGSEDGNDSDPGIPLQQVKAFLDTLTCPQVGVPGTIGVLGISVILTDQTQFEDNSCEALAAMIVPTVPPAPPVEPVRVNLRLVEDAAGVLTAVKIESHHADDQNKDED